MPFDRLRLPLLVAAIMLLPACNAVMSEHPMLNGVPGAAQVPRPGLWLSTEPDCKVATTGPARSWPNCAHWLILDPRGTITLSDKDRADGPPDPVLAIRFGASDPALAEIHLTSSKDPTMNGYTYFAYAPDGAGQGRELTRLRFWSVNCGPSRTVKFPGMDDQCRPASLPAILAAARNSSDDNVQTMHWVRQPGRGDRPVGDRAR